MPKKKVKNGNSKKKIKKVKKQSSKKKNIRWC
uniref:Uncharacterized protein n=1 Tax=Florenciella sp. virus SA2 TaxID=3240092 RepID=A0AB39JDD9_9VIRU